MSFDSEFWELQKTTSKKKKKKDEEEKKKLSNKLYAQKLIESDLAPHKIVENNVKSGFTSPLLAPTVTPSKKTEEEDEEWYKKIVKKPELFDDGYQAGDITKTILGTAGDLTLGVLSGAGNFVEGIADTIGYGVADVSEALGAEDFANATRERVKKNTIQQVLGKPTEKVDKWSVLDDTADSVAQGLGMIATLAAGGAALGAAGLGAGATTAITTGATGLSGFGSGMSEAYQGGATEKEAKTYGAIVGASEALSELLFGGLGKASKALGFSKGLSSLDDMAAKKVANMFSSQFAKNLAEYGVKSGAEGAEEVISGIAQIIGKKITYMSEEELGKIWEDENLLEQFVIGSVTSSFAQASGLHKATKTGTDFITGLKENEQMVVDKVVESRIAELEEKGEKVTNKTKNKIYDEVIEDLDKGYLDTEQMESLLGGEDYEKYKAFTDKASAYEAKLNEGIEKMQQRHDELQAEYDKLNELDLTKAKLGDHNRQNEIKDEMASLKEKIQQWNTELEAYTNDEKTNELKTNLKNKVSQSVYELVKDSRLGESYRELERSKYKYEADTNQYKNEYAKKTVQNAIDSELFRNSNADHDAVDFIAKVTSKLGLVCEFTNNERITNNYIESQTKRIAELEKIPEVQRTQEQINELAKMKDALAKVQSGKLKVNGNTTKGVITINLDSVKPVEFITGHEVLHNLIKSKAYKNGDLHKAFKSYLGKKEYARRLEEVEQTYEGNKTIPEEELVANLVGEYVFNDYDFVMHLATNNQNIFQQAWDSIKHLYKMATAGSKEARDLERVKRTFEKAYKEVAKVQKNTAEGGVRYSIKYTRKMDYDEQIEGHFNGTLQGSNSIYIGEPSENLQKIGFSSNPFAMNQGDLRKSNEKSAKNKKYSRHGVPRKFFRNMPKYINEAVIFIENENGITVVTDYPMLDEKGQPSYVIAGVSPDASLDNDNVNLVKSVYPLDDFASRITEAAESGRLVITDKQKAREMLATIGVQPSEPSNLLELSKDSISQNSEKSSENEKHSLSDEQETYFKDSKVRDENGNLKVMYHGTKTSGFTVFDHGHQKFGLFGNGFYFTDDVNVADGYTKDGYGTKQKDSGVYEAYLNITNPIDMDAYADKEKWVSTIAETFNESADVVNAHLEKLIENMSERMNGARESVKNSDMFYIMRNVMNDLELSKFEAGELAEECIRSMGYDGITHIGGGFFNRADSNRHRVYIAFEPEQIKNIDNTAPTKNADIRYSLSEDSEGNKLTEKQSEYFADSKAVDRNGNLLKVYHTTKNDFTVFDKTRKGEATEDANTYLGFFFSDDAEYMQNFPEFENGKTESYYLDMKNPIDMTNISREAFMDIVEVMGGDVGDASILYDEELEAASDRAKLRGDNNVSLHLGNLLDELTGEFYYDDFIRELKPHYDELMSKGYDGVINYMDELFGVKEYIVLDSHQAKLTSNLNPSADADVRYSLSEDSQGRELSKEQQDFFKGVSPLLKDENGNIKRYYHGTARGDRVGTLFDPERATSGPMAFFTDNPEIAEGYSKSKADTSMSYDPDYDSYETQFRVNINGNDMSLINAWRYLPMSAKARIKDRAEHTHYDWDDYETLIYDEETTEAGGGFSWQLREARGNVLQALNEQWLNSGNLFNEEGKYIDVLKFIGVHDEFKKLGYGEPYYKDPYYREEKVFEVYLNVTNPFHTADVDEEFLNDARDWVDNTDLSIYESETADSDLWDKRSLDPYEWLDRLEDDIKNGTTHAWTSIPDVITDFLKEYGGYDGIVDAGGKHTGYGHQVVIPFYSEQIKNIDNETPTTDAHIDLSLSDDNGTSKGYATFYGRKIANRNIPLADIAPVKETVSKTEQVKGTVNEDDFAPMTEAEAEAMYEADRGYINSFTDADMPPEMDAPIYSSDTTSIDEKALNNIARTVKDALSLNVVETKAIKDIIQKYSTSEYQSEADLFEEIKANFGEKSWSERNEEIANVKQVLRGYKVNVSPFIKRDIKDYPQFMRRNFGKLTFSKSGMPVDTAYMELSDAYPNLFPASITNATDQLLQMSEVANMDINETQTAMLDDESIQEATELIVDVVNTYKENELLKGAKAQGREFLKNANKYEEEMPKISNDFAPTREYEAIEPRPDVLSDEEAQWAKNKMARADKVDAEEKPKRRSELHQSIVDRLKGKFTEKGFDFDDVLNKAKNLSTIATVDNIPQRVMEKAFGYKQGQILADETVNKVAQNESEGIKWLNSFTDRKNGVLAQISKQYNIKPGSKKSAAAQMYAEGFYVDKNNEIIEYGDRELAIDFPDLKVQENIKGLARDPRIRKIYDDTLNAINESRSRNLYPEIPRLDNYFLHFRAMEDTFSQLGLPFNPNDIRAKDLPTDLNGVTADLKPGQPYFASAKHREGMRTSFDLLGGLERYLSSAKNQIYHIDDIQTLRALRNYIADTYGQAKGLESLDDLTDEEAQYRIEQVYSSHLSTFAKFLNEEANVLAGKTTLIDRGLEGVFGRKAFAFFDTLNKQVGSNMVGWNISSSLTNFLPVAQTFAKTNKFDFTKAFAQTVSSKIGSIFGKTDSFVENNPTIIRRKGAERFYRTPYQKIGDAGYVLMSAVDDISTELIVRTKYNELIRKGMDEQKASFEADKWVSRLMGDRSLGQQPQLYNSKGLGLLTKFQLEVRNQLDSQFYDTIQEAKVSNEEIENKLLKNAKTAAKVTSVFFQLAAVQHLYGMAFESIAGYNPAFDIIDVLIKTLGFDDDEEDEDTPLDNIGEGFLTLLDDLPYTSIVTGGRIPFSSALPSWESIKQIATGEDEYGNKKSRVETFTGMLNDTVPYYVLPTGFGQIKKTAKGLKMFSDEHPVAGSYTDSGNLRFPVEDTPLNRVQAGVFGQYANKNARIYFDEDYAPLKEKQIQEYAESEMPIADYWKYREGLKDFTKQAEKAAYINGLDISQKQKDVLKSYLYDEEGYKEENPEKYAFLEREGIGYLGYKELDEDTQSAWSWAFKHQDEYEYYKENGVLPGDYSTYYIPMLEFEDEDDEAYTWAFDNPEKATVGKVFGEGVKEYRQYSKDLNEIRADKDENGKSISGSAKEKKKAYIWSLPIDYGQKIILYRSLYDSKDDKATYNQDIIDYLNSRDDISYDEMNTICEELGFTVNRDTGYISWD